MENKEMYELTADELLNIDGGYYPPTEEQLEALREIFGPGTDMICW